MQTFFYLDIHMPWLQYSETGPSIDSLPVSFLEHWQSLALSTNQADPFCCAPIWNTCYQDAMAPNRDIFYEKSSDCAIILCKSRFSTGEPILVPMEDGWNFGQPLLGDHAPYLLYDLVPVFIRDFPQKFPVIFISGIREKSIFAATLFKLFSRYFRIFRHDRSLQARASLEGGLDGWFSRRSANHRAKLRKAQKHAKKLGVSFERQIADAATAKEIYARMLKIEQKSWKGINQCGMNVPPSNIFYERLITLLAEKNNAVIIFAKYNDNDIGFIFGGICGNCYRGQQFSYAQEYAKFSIGNLLQLEQISWLCELGILNYDMGPASGPKMDYKFHWTEDIREIQTWILQRAM